MQGQPLLSAVVVHWGNPAPLAALLDAWPADPRFELLVVDNGGADVAASDGGKERAAADAVWARVEERGRLLRPGRNLGFGGGANAGARAARGDLLLILNPDARPEPGALEALLDGFAAHPEAAGLAPRLVGEDGEAQFRWQLRRLPSAAQLLLQALLVPAVPESAVEPAAGTAVEQPAAAALALRRAAFDAAGGFDPGFYAAWFEDVDLAARLAGRGERLLYHPAALFRHGLGGTVGQLGFGRFLAAYQRNLVRYLRLHHGRGAAALARLLLPAGLLWRLLAVPLRKPRRATSRRDAAAGLLAALGAALTGWRGVDDAAQLAAAAGGAWRTGGGATQPPGADRPLSEAQRDTGEESDGETLHHTPAAVTVCIVTHDDAGDLAGCFDAVAALRHRPLDVVLVDCASGDGTVAEARRLAPRLEGAGVPLTVVPLDDNRGFAGGMNAALARSAAPWALSLNADARPRPGYVDRLLARAAALPHLRVGALTGRLLRPADGDGRRRLDACGMRLARTWRHLDRGSGEADRGQYGNPARVFGATGAASLFRRAALIDAALDDAALEDDEQGDRAIFDPRFHSFREDAELAFRLRERGWEVVYEPAAVAEHRRSNLPERRRAMPSQVNFHSLKNRYLLRAYHQSRRNLFVTLVPTLARDLGALGYCLLLERTSLPAYGWLWRQRREIVARRRRIQARRTVAARQIDRWFGRSEMPL